MQKCSKAHTHTAPWKRVPLKEKQFLVLCHEFRVTGVGVTDAERRPADAALESERVTEERTKRFV